MTFARRPSGGEQFEIGRGYSGFLEGFECEMRAVDQSHYHDYLGWCRWLYRGNSFKAVQLVYPDTKGVWPWESRASARFRRWQLLLDRPAVPNQRN